MLRRLHTCNRQTRTMDTIVFFPPQNHKLPSQPTPEEILVQAAAQLGKALQSVACNNPAYPSLHHIVELKQLTEAIKTTTGIVKPNQETSETNQTLPAITKENKKETPRHLPTGPHLIEITTLEQNKSAELRVTWSHTHIPIIMQDEDLMQEPMFNCP